MNPKDITRLWEEMRNRDPEEKAAWIRDLARDPSDESLETLLSVLEQESWFLREQACRALVPLGERVVEPLIEYLGSGLWYTRASAASVLGRMGLPAAADPLTGLLSDANRTVRDAAWDALARLAEIEPGAHATAEAFAALPERARRFALDGILARSPEAAGRVLRSLEDIERHGVADRALPRAVNQSDTLSWEDVVGGDRDESSPAGR
jgi:hypothetical protein